MLKQKQVKNKSYSLQSPEALEPKLLKETSTKIKDEMYPDVRTIDDNKIDVKTKTSQKQVIYVASKALKHWSLSYLYIAGLSVQLSAQCQIYIKTTNMVKPWQDSGQ